MRRSTDPVMTRRNIKESSRSEQFCGGDDSAHAECFDGERQSHIDLRLDEILASISGLNDRICELQSRLRPVVRPYPEKDDGKPQDCEVMPNCCDIARRLIMAANGLRELSDSLSVTLLNLEI